MSPKDKRQLAREHLHAAKAAARDERLNDAVNALFYAAEAAVVALADQYDIDTKKHHGLKADAASELHTRGLLTKDFGPVLRILNQARKDIWYEGEEPELDGELKDLVAQVEDLVKAVKASA
ncbi:MAG: HEPN domain-containing protein [Solirubrobacteraceae bacterium]